MSSPSAAPMEASAPTPAPEAQAEGPDQACASGQQLNRLLKHSFEVLHEVLPLASSLVQDKTERLSDEFRRLSTAAYEQGQQMGAIVQTVSKVEYNGESISYADFVELFNHTVDSSIQQVVNTSRLSMQTVFELREATKKLSDMQKFTSQIQQVNKQTNLLALNATIEATHAGSNGESFAVVAGEVKAVSETINTLSRDIQDRIQAIFTSVESAFSTLNEIATTDMTENLLAQEKLQGLVQGLVNQNERLGQVMHKHADNARTLSESIQLMTIDMQFQDRHSQYLENAQLVLKALEAVICRAEELEITSINHCCDYVLGQIKLSQFREQLHQRLYEDALIATAPHATSSDEAAGEDDEDGIDLF